MPLARRLAGGLEAGTVSVLQVVSWTRLGNTPTLRIWRRCARRCQQRLLKLRFVWSSLPLCRSRQRYLLLICDFTTEDFFDLCLCTNWVPTSCGGKYIAVYLHVVPKRTQYPERNAKFSILWRLSNPASSASPCGDQSTTAQRGLSASKRTQWALTNPAFEARSSPP